MKNVIYLFVLAFIIPVTLTAQTRVDAKDIIKKINSDQPVKYDNVTITGDLDFTMIDNNNENRKVEKRDKRSWFEKLFSSNHNSSNEIIYQVEVPVELTNCIFEGDVIAYYHDDHEDITHNVNFFEKVDFSGSEFKRASEFKYCEFDKSADFEKTIFQEEALFKYTRFSKQISFAGSKFYDSANFKYTAFEESVNFSNAYFDREADFKYTKFPYGVSFKNSVFEGYANFKYADFDEPSDLDGVEFNGDVDFKYTKYAGSSLVKYLLKSRKN